MKNTPKISVILPIYKVEKYLLRCLFSIKRQTFKDYEVLIINDGSPDRSPEIAKTFCRNDSRFRLYNKPNGGLSDARNFGIDLVRGEYIAFVDSDDHIHKDYLKDMYEACKKYDADMAICKFKYSYFNTGLKLPRPSVLRSCELTKDQALEYLIRDTKLQSYAWNKLYKTKLFKDTGIRYPYMFFEDIATSSRLLHNANKLAVCGKYLYYYEKRFGSIMGTMNMEKVTDYWRSALAVRNYFQYAGAYEKYKPAIIAFAKKVHGINIYSIVRQHILHFDFRKIRYNLDTNTDIFRYVVSDEYVPIAGIPEVPYKFVQPGHKKNSTKKEELQA